MESDRFRKNGKPANKPQSSMVPGYLLGKSPSSGFPHGATEMSHSKDFGDWDKGFDDYTSDPAFKAHARALKQDLAPVGAAETLLVDRIILTGWRMSTAADELGVDLEEPEAALERAEDRAEKAFYRALAAFEKLRSRREKTARTEKDTNPGWGKAAEGDSKAAVKTNGHTNGHAKVLKADHILNLGDIPPHKGSANGKAKHEDLVPGTPPVELVWRDRLVSDPSVSPDSPVVKGTRVTVRRVISLIVDGWTWDAILLEHPDLTEDDVRACLAYAVEEEGASLRPDPGTGTGPNGNPWPDDRPDPGPTG